MNDPDKQRIYKEEKQTSRMRDFHFKVLMSVLDLSFRI